MSSNSSSPNLIEIIDKAKKKFVEIAPPEIKFEAEARFALALISNNSHLRQVATEHPGSFRESVLQVATIGLTLNPAEKLAYLITRNIKVAPNRWETRVFLDPSYQGLVRLATNSGVIKWVQSRAVYASDEFIDKGVGNAPEHNYSPFANRDSRGEFVGVYCVAKTSEGDHLTEIMPSADVFNIRGRSEAYKAFIENKKGSGGPWVSDFIEMAKKAVVRRGFKMWPRSEGLERLASAVNISNENEGFAPIMSNPAEQFQYTAKQKEYFDQLINQSKPLEMHFLSSTIEPGVFQSLYHSFETQKGKNQRIVDDLLSRGRDILSGMIAEIEECAEMSDESGVYELIEGLQDPEIDLIRFRVDKRAREIVDEVRNWSEDNGRIAQ